MSVGLKACPVVVFNGTWLSAQMADCVFALT